MDNIGMLSSLGQEFIDMPGQNRVRQAVWSVWKMFGFFWVFSLVWIQFDIILVVNGWVWGVRRQTESAHPLAVLRCLQVRGVWCLNHMAHNSGLSQQRIHSSFESPCVSYQGTEAGKSRTSLCKVFTSPLQCLARSFLLKSQVFLVFYPKQTPAANCNECNICRSFWGLNV